MTFRSLDWIDFQHIRQLLAERTQARFTYDNGVLEITMPLEGHERLARLIELFIRILVVELGLKMKSMGSTTLARKDLLKSAEPDNGYYIQNYALVADHEVDLAVDPPPDLVVEVDITHSDIQKNELYASLGVPEFWRFNGRQWTILQLVERRYEDCERSPTFPLVAKTDLYHFLSAAIADEVMAELNFRQWVRAQTASTPLDFST
ncbi:Uma2 family endonuclease [Synechococcales cyanobacterium C]|uniref:Uma2 family endonuclease n=1 Tax=Petrachloros mirabilis ULC683 TaxID=2781853 RepID=A0A8K2A1L4_9CYAN|nr:Uma2 family endonuclease [Petrachloros mirabilis]NCJ08158.1 Uma2 family endonuclease [Petrachloros mirabilis ULC683]